MNWIPVSVPPPENTPLLVAKVGLVFAETVLWCHRKGFYRLDDYHRNLRQDYEYYCDIRTLNKTVPVK